MQTQKRVVASVGLAAMIGLAGGSPAPAQVTSSFRPTHCGPGTFLPGEVVLNVGRVDTGSGGPSTVVVRFVGADRNVLLEQPLSLLPGQSRALALPLEVRTLVRAEVVPTSGPDGLEVRATLQSFQTGADGLTYGVGFGCPVATSGDTIPRPIG